MNDFFGIKIDTQNMTLEELKETQKKVKELYSDISLQITLRKISEHKHSTSN